MNTRVKVVVSDHIAEVVLSRAEKMNALDEVSFAELVSAASEIKSDPQVRVVIIRGDGEHFCSGADKAFLQGAVSDNDVFRQRALELPAGEMANEFQKPVMSWFELDIPVIVCLQGVVYGAGMQLALAADIRIASPSLAMSLFEIHWGLVPDMGVSVTLPRLLRADLITELMLTGRVVDAEEALRIGLVTHVKDDPLVTSRELAMQIAQMSPDAVSKGKRLIRESAQLRYAQRLALEAELQSELVGTPNQQEAVMAKLEKRKPVFL